MLIVKRIPFFTCLLINWLIRVQGHARDICTVQPTISGLCVSSTLGIYYDVETQRCKYLGCSPDKKLFATLEDCERICNNSRHRRRRVQQHQSSSGSGLALA